MTKKAKTWLGLDWGQKKIGWATADPDGILVSPRAVLMRKAQKSALQDPTWQLTKKDGLGLKTIVDENEIGQIVLGLPQLAQAKDSRNSALARSLAQELEQFFGLPVFLFNEYLTSWEHRHQENEDSLAAASILRGFLEEYLRRKK